MLIELGSGERPFEDGRSWTHNDIRPGPDIEIVCPAEDISSHLREKANEIRATHLLEHFSYCKTVQVLKDWFAALKPGGLLYIEVPNLEWQIKAAYEGEISLEEFVYFAYGEQNYEFNFHYSGFGEGILKKCLNQAGFNVTGFANIGQVLCAKALKPYN